MTPLHQAHPRDFLLVLFQHAIDAVSPAQCMPSHLQNIFGKLIGKKASPPNAVSPTQSGRMIVIGAGKAAAAMAVEVERFWPGHSPLCGLVVTRYGHGLPTHRIEVREASHPLPDSAGLQAAQDMLHLVANLNSNDIVLCLMSGGGSALLASPAPEISLEQKQAISRALLTCGAGIHEINCVRKHLSAIKGGRLALACGPARLITLGISDIPGDDLGALASGPTIADATTRQQALNILQHYRIPIPDTVKQHLNSPNSETPKPGDPRFSRHQARVIANAGQALNAAANFATQQGLQVHVLGDDLEDESRDLAEAHALLAKQIYLGQHPFLRTPCLLLSGGETRITIDPIAPAGKGGRSAEYLLALGLALEVPGWAIACDTDGIDGTEHNAGAWFGPDWQTRAKGLNLVPADYLRDHNSYSLFEALGQLVVTGPTRTNVNDFRALYLPAQP